jgi:dTDP-4-amino-4,6-dideoxygalactose transaminase
MDPARLDAARTPRTRIVMPVHLYGRLVDLPAIGAWCAAHGVGLVEDAAQAHGAAWGGRRAGAFGDAAGFSFYPAKNLGAAGDAGALVTTRPDVAERVRRLRDHGQSERYHHAVVGYNSRLDALQAAVLAIKLTRLAGWNERRRALAALYRERLTKVAGVELLAEPAEPASHVHHLFVVRSPERDRLRAALSARGIETGLHYPVPVHLQAGWRHLGYGEGDFPVAEAAARTILSLPIYPQMTEDAVHRVCDALEASA